MMIRVFAALALTSGAAWAAAAEPTSLGIYDDWQAYTYRAKDSRVCYIYSEPKATSAGKKSIKRDPTYFLVSHYPGRKVKNEISTIIGYPFKDGAVVKISVDANDFELYSHGDTAWADSGETDAAILSAMKNGKSLKVVGTSSRGTETTDTYSLAGVGAAMDKIDTACK